MSGLLKAQSAIISYEGNYAEWHPIRYGKLGIGKPLTKEMLSELKTLIDSENTIQSINGIIPKGVYYINTSSFDFKLIWHSPEQERKLYFKKSTGYVIVPQMIWSIKNNTLKVFFANSSKEKSFLYQAAFPNLDSDGTVCFGNVAWKPKSSSSIEEIIRLTERAFFNSIFTNEIRVVFTEKFDLVEEWKVLMSKQSNNKRKCMVPQKMLIKQKSKIQDLWNEYI